MQKQLNSNIDQVSRLQIDKNSLGVLENKIQRFNFQKVFQLKIFPSYNQDININDSSKNKIIRKRKENWNITELKILFDTISIEGPRWSLIQNLFQNKSQNSVKNKFYGTIKSFIKAILKYSKNLSGNYLNNINSLRLIDLYLGNKQFRKFKGFLKKYLEKMNYQINTNQIFLLVNQQNQKINQLYQVIFCPNNNKKSQTKSNKVTHNGKQILKIEQEQIKVINQEKSNHQQSQIQLMKQSMLIYPIQTFNHYGNLYEIYPTYIPYKFLPQNPHDFYQK